MLPWDFSLRATRKPQGKDEMILKGGKAVVSENSLETFDPMIFLTASSFNAYFLLSESQKCLTLF